MITFPTPRIDWVGLRKSCFTFSMVLVAAGAAVILTKGFRYSIEFTGGTMVQVKYDQPKTLAALRADLEKAGFAEAEPQSFSGTHAFVIRIQTEAGLDNATVDRMVAALAQADPGSKFTVEAREYVGPTVGRHLKRQAIIAIILAMIAIVIYVAFRFESPLWGAAGLTALFHDIIATAGLLALLERQIDLVMVAALLTIAGYSMNDTIVIFDRMRERGKHNRRESLAERINFSINQNISRTVITNGCVVFAVGALFFFGGPGLHDFATAMLFGAFVSTYSTVAVAVPLVYQLQGEK